MRIGPIKIKVQIYCGDALAMGPGKADLLDAIATHGSISAAGRALGMSYRRAWMLVDEMNRCWSAPLIETTAGGGQGRGARLTTAAHEVRAAYRALEERLASATPDPSNDRLSAGLRATPLPPHTGP